MKCMINVLFNDSYIKVLLFMPATAYKKCKEK